MKARCAHGRIWYRPCAKCATPELDTLPWLIERYHVNPRAMSVQFVDVGQCPFCFEVVKMPAFMDGQVEAHCPNCCGLAPAWAFLLEFESRMDARHAWNS